jgi:hypothetical protein
MRLGHLGSRVKRKYNALWVDLRYVEVFGHPMWHVVVKPLVGDAKTVAGRHETPRRALRAALKSSVTLPTQDAHEGPTVPD